MSDDEGMSIHADQEDTDIEEPPAASISKRGRVQHPTTKAAARRKTAGRKPTGRKTAAKVYVSGINDYIVEEGHPSLLKHSAIQRALLGFRRLHPPLNDKRLPITLPILRHIHRNIKNSPSLSPLIKALFWSACKMAYVGFLRASEFTTTGRNAAHTLQHREVVIAHDSVKLRLRSSKTDQHKAGSSMKLPATRRSLCPVDAAQPYLELRPLPVTHYEAFFVLHDNSPLTRRMFVSHLQNLLHGVAHLDRYSTRSFRIGAATEASNQGRAPEETQQAGRWKSSCYNDYIRNKKHTMGLHASLTGPLQLRGTGGRLMRQAVTSASVSPK
ncbi:hypothetical protein RvY_16908 [Ramazzottius varieornatus]|uniref:Tyr recombinase domain-containing protein n=1 Tax=Ramazzottius varieornatus TaxID=947166 RepID=A0A1D1W062_RAMVA|nr:hypothetical protein RvY_16908 [Ramazzottius varieornatus]